MKRAMSIRISLSASMRSASACVTCMRIDFAAFILEREIVGCVLVTLARFEAVQRDRLPGALRGGLAILRGHSFIDARPHRDGELFHRLGIVHPRDGDGATCERGSGRADDADQVPTRIAL